MRTASEQNSFRHSSNPGPIRKRVRCQRGIRNAVAADVSRLKPPLIHDLSGLLPGEGEPSLLLWNFVPLNLPDGHPPNQDPPIAASGERIKGEGGRPNKIHSADQSNSERDLRMRRLNLPLPHCRAHDLPHPAFSPGEGESSAAALEFRAAEFAGRSSTKPGPADSYFLSWERG